ncbi:MAG: response regulator, partial [Acidobacteriota bacterium]
NILVFEDDPVTGTLMRAVLTNRGYEVEVVSTAEAGLERTAVSPPGLILMDIGLAGEMDGLEALRRLRSQAITKKVPVVVLTGREEPEVRKAAEEAGSSAFLNKPVARTELHEVVGSFLPPPEAA